MFDGSEFILKFRLIKLQFFTILVQNLTDLILNLLVYQFNSPTE